MKVVAGLLDHFRRHPEWGADECESLRLDVGKLCCNAKVRNLHKTGVGKEDIRSFDITMDLAGAVQIVETLEQLFHDHGNVLLLHRPGLEQVETTAATEVFHDDPQLGAADEGSAVAGDVGGVAGGEETDLLLDLANVIVAAFEVDVLDGDVFGGWDMEGAVNNAEGAT